MFDVLCMISIAVSLDFFDTLEKRIFKVICSSSQNAGCPFRPDGPLPVPQGPTAQEPSPSDGHARPHPQNSTPNRPHPDQQVPGLGIHRPHCQEGEI